LPGKLRQTEPEIYTTGPDADGLRFIANVFHYVVGSFVAVRVAWL
jgi:hypothetical protein